MFTLVSVLDCRCLFQTEEVQCVSAGNSRGGGGRGRGAVSVDERGGREVKVKGGGCQWGRGG